MMHPALCPPADRAYAVIRLNLQVSHPKWHIWEKHFIATKTTPDGGVTLVCESWKQLALELEAEDTAQAMRDAA
jgi:hypothetical protein